MYQRLYETVKAGRSAVLVTRCLPDAITRELSAGDAPAQGAGTPDSGGADALCFEKRENGIALTEYFSPMPRLIILGAGHIALPLASMGAMLNFDVVVFDDRMAFANAARFPRAEVVCDYFEAMPARLAVRDSDYVAIVTRGHKYDKDCLRALLRGTVPCYVGMIGSRRRVNIVRRQLLDEGVTSEALSRVHSPIGLGIGAVTPEEIAVSILAEMIQERRRGTGALSGASSCTDMELLRALAANDAAKAVIVTVLSTKGSTPREAGAKMLIHEDGHIVGSIGGGCAEADVLRDARRILREGGHCCKTIDMTDSAEEDGMVCGGMMEVLIEAYP